MLLETLPYDELKKKIDYLSDLNKKYVKEICKLESKIEELERKGLKK